MSFRALIHRGRSPINGQQKDPGKEGEMMEYEYSIMAAYIVSLTPIPVGGYANINSHN